MAGIETRTMKGEEVLLVNGPSAQSTFTSSSAVLLRVVLGDKLKVKTNLHIPFHPHQPGRLLALPQPCRRPLLIYLGEKKYNLPDE